MEALCTNGRKATSISVEERHDGALYIYGFYYEDGKKHKCYVGPADPRYVLNSMPAAFLVEPEAWGLSLLAAFERTVRNAVSEGRPEVIDWLRRVHRELGRLLEEAGEAREGGSEEEGEELPA